MRYILMSPLVNAFHLDGDIIALATCKGFIVLDNEYKVLQELLYRKILGDSYEKRFGQSLCCEPAYEHDGNAFLISFSHGNKIDESIRGDNEFMGEYT